MSLELPDCRAVVALADERSFGRAAASLGISQPALSRRVAALERRMGGPLFAREPRGVTLTAAGSVLEAHARRVLAEAEAAVAATRRAALGETGELRIGVGLAVLLAGLPAVVAAYRRRYPEVRSTVRDLSTAAQVAALEAGELDVGFVRMPAGRLAAERVMTDRLALVSRADARRGADMPFLVLSREVSPTFHDHVLATCRAAGIVPRRVQEAGDLLTLLTLAQAGVGVGLAPESARALGLADLRFRRVRVAEARWEIGMVARAGAAAARFAAMARRGLTRAGSGRTLPAASG